MDPAAAVEDFRQRVAHYTDVYEQINQFDDEGRLAWIKVCSACVGRVCACFTLELSAGRELSPCA